ncbi:T9SS type A sorting domain-containing protein [Flavobacterium orientale]|uniref:Por secretion system C-terminal sorting domain-containing protein n=1 Tax=Flavobacterium orientale TaxID=1756020 RepID=A0A917DAB3_9FLAO|nr:T9SS type A sorting domain-containing protein [Flavobacterium orientale]GGD19424.1 hypothetical protein GCM10011343_07510 [Flavobacterium orientale]
MKCNFAKSLLFLLLVIPIISFGQTNNTNSPKVFGKTVESINPESGLIKCVSSEYESYLSQNNPNRMSTEAFETWIAPQIAKIKSDRQNGRNVNAVITIPLVVHVIHSGQTLGIGRNISDARVQSQITVLNQDFRRMFGTPGYNTNPVGADVEIEFCLAQTGPDGQAVTGINRVNLGNTIWNSSNVENILKPQTQWNPNQYFNIWVCQFGGDLNGVLGYAQFPSASGLGGMPSNGGLASTDGVIIEWRAFGTSTLSLGEYFTGTDKGRTTTHEIGHSFGLRHIWGDNNSCTVNLIDSLQDYCPDTPAASQPNYSCTIGLDSCPSASGLDMTANYMDYSSDSCMNIFTLNQKSRIQAVLLNSPRRSTFNSLFCNVGQTYQFNGRLRMNPIAVSDCNTSFLASFQLTNTGTVTMTSAVITYSIDNGPSQNYTWTGSLPTNVSTTVFLPLITSTPGNHIFNANLSTINGSNPDQFSFNDTINEPFRIAGNQSTSQITIQIQRDVYGSETTWSFVNATTGITLASGGDYTDTNTFLPELITVDVPVQLNNCYTFTINDSFGDGICCDFGPGYYNIITLEGVTIASGGSFTSTDSVSFNNIALSVSDNNMLSSIKLYPNPTSGDLTIAMPDISILPNQFVVYNALGQIMASQKINNESDLTFDTSSMSPGVYFVKIMTDSNSKTLQFIKK